MAHIIKQSYDRRIIYMYTVYSVALTNYVLKIMTIWCMPTSYTKLSLGYWHMMSWWWQVVSDNATGRGAVVSVLVLQSWGHWFDLLLHQSFWWDFKPRSLLHDLVVSGTLKLKTPLQSFQKYSYETFPKLISWISNDYSFKIFRKHLARIR